jgi:hypothetical protein
MQPGFAAVASGLHVPDWIIVIIARHLVKPACIKRKGAMPDQFAAARYIRKAYSMAISR